MRFGCCAELEQIKMVQDAGYDYIELPVSCIDAEAPEQEFEQIMEDILSYDIPPEVWHHLLEKDMKVVGPETDPYRVERYIRTAFKRIEDLGGEVVVFGSAGARTIPDGFPRDEAIDQVVDFLSLAGQIAGQHGLYVAVEPLSSSQTNLINSLAETMEIVTLTGHPFVKVLTDFYEMQAIGESVESLVSVGADIIHAHTADTGRRRPGSGNLPQKSFLQTLKKAGYNDRVSVQCIFDDPKKEMKEAVEYLRSL